MALWLTARRYVARGGSRDVVWDAAIVAIPCGIVGGRLYHVATDWEKYFGAGADPLDVLRITNGGLGVWGAVFLGGVGVWLFFRWKKLPLGPFADAIAPGIILAQAIGRLGNWFNQELYGRATDVPWALDIYYRVGEDGRYAPLTGHSTGELIASVHPTFLYELVWNVVVFCLLLWADRRFRLGHGRVFALYVAGYTFGRFWIELMRDDAATHVFGLRINTIVSSVVFVAACAVFVWIGKKAADGGRREAPAVVRGEDHSAERGDEDAALS